jgi:cell division septation protein DedD
MENVDTPEPAEQNAETKTKKKDKVRSAWISFAGRIVAQLVGAIATVALGVMVLHRYTAGDARPGHPNAVAALGAPPAASAPVQSPVHIIVLTPAMLGLGDAGQHLVAPERGCSPRLDTPPTTAAHLDNGTFLSR